ncbi:MAG: hypothetical protein P8P30_05200 [Rickettsiales bacterium]|nr:hypothetical protein [Rickettsiales bacterium]
MTVNITQIRTGRLAGEDTSYGIIYAPEKAMPGSLGGLRDFLIEKGLKAEPGYESNKHVLRVSGFHGDASLRGLLSEEFSNWQSKHPIGVSGKVAVHRDVPILSLDKKPNEQKSKSFKAWLHKNATGLVGFFATFSGLSMVLASTPDFRFKMLGEKGSLLKLDKDWKKGDVVKYMPGGKSSDGTLIRQPLQKGEVKLRRVLQFASMAFVAAAGLLFSFGFSKNRSMNEILQDADTALETSSEGEAFKEAQNEGVSKAHNWVKQNVWKIASPLNIVGGVFFTGASIARAGIEGKNPRTDVLTGKTIKAGNVFMQAFAGFTGFLAQFLIVLMPKSKVAGFGGLDTYVANEGNQAVQDQYKQIESQITGKAVARDESKGKAFFQKHQMKIASRLSILSNFFFGGIPAIKQIKDPTHKSPPKEKFFYGVFVNNMFADYFTGLSVPSSSHAPEYIYSTLAEWVNKKLPADATAERTDEFIAKASKWLASQSEVQMKATDIAKGVKTVLSVEHGRQHCETDVDIAAKLAQLKVVSPFASSSRVRANQPTLANNLPTTEQEPDHLAQETKEPAQEQKRNTDTDPKERPSVIQELAENKPEAGYREKVENQEPTPQISGP